MFCFPKIPWLRAAGKTLFTYWRWICDSSILFCSNNSMEHAISFYCYPLFNVQIKSLPASRPACISCFTQTLQKLFHVDKTDKHSHIPACQIWRFAAFLSRLKLRQRGKSVAAVKYYQQGANVAHTHSVCKMPHSAATTPESPGGGGV